MASNNDFIVKNGLQVTSNIILGNYVTNVNPITVGIVNGIASSGNVGIGTNTVLPGTKLMVTRGNINLNSNSGVQTGFGVIFPDNTFQTTAFSADGSIYQVQLNDGTNSLLASSNFYYNTSTNTLGAGTTSGGTVQFFGNSPALISTSNGTNTWETVIGNSTATGSTIGYNSTSPIVGYLKISGGTQAITWNTSGSVGINAITSPKSSLDIGGAVAVGTAYAGVVAGPSNGLIVQGLVGIGTSLPVYPLDVRSISMFRQNVTIASSNISSSISTGALVINGGLGVGDNVYVSGNVVLAATGSQFDGTNNDTVTSPSYAWTGDVTTGMYRVSTGAIGFSSGGLQVARFSKTGFLGTNFVAGSPANLDTQQILTLTNNVAISGVTFSGSDARLLSATITPTNEVTWRAQALGMNAINYMQFTTSNAVQMYIDPIGNVGINTSDPLATLDVAGWTSVQNGLNVQGSAIVSSLTSNNAITSSTSGFIGGPIFATSINTSGLVRVSSLNSNGTIQSAGTATVNALTSNGVVTSSTSGFVGGPMFASTLNSSGLVRISSLTSNGVVTSSTSGFIGGPIYASTFNTGGSATVNSLVSNGTVSATSVTVGGSGVLTTSNYNTYAPTLTGTGASGSWGISVTGSAASLSSKYTATIGDGSSTTYTVTHNLNDANITVVIKEVSSGYLVFPDIQQTSNNAISVQFTTAPTTNQYSVLVIAV